jgi:hypothetical protein
MSAARGPRLQIKCEQASLFFRESDHTYNHMILSVAPPQKPVAG